MIIAAFLILIEVLLNSVFVFDLDDTLYREFEYRKSGIVYISRFLERLFGFSVPNGVLEDLLENPRSDFIRVFIEFYSLGDHARESLLWLYRLHPPTLSLSANVRQVFTTLDDFSLPYFIITDGRSISQRLKVLALGLSGEIVFVSEEFGGAPKPCAERFLLVQNLFPGKDFFYIGDNPLKDFVAPRSLGWKTICLSPHSAMVHKYDVASLSEGQLPHAWCDNFSTLFSLAASLL